MGRKAQSFRREDCKQEEKVEGEEVAKQKFKSRSSLKLYQGDGKQRFSKEGQGQRKERSSWGDVPYDEMMRGGETAMPLLPM